MPRKVTYDQEKVKELRMQIILDSLAVFNDSPTVEKWSQFRKDLLMKYAPRVLPVLNAGRDDDKDLIPAPLLGGQAAHGNNRNHSNEEAPAPTEED